MELTFIKANYCTAQVQAIQELQFFLILFVFHFSDESARTREAERRVEVLDEAMENEILCDEVKMRFRKKRIELAQEKTVKEH